MAQGSMAVRTGCMGQQIPVEDAVDVSKTSRQVVSFVPWDNFRSQLLDPLAPMRWYIATSSTCLTYLLGSVAWQYTIGDCNYVQHDVHGVVGSKSGKKKFLYQ